VTNQLAFSRRLFHFLHLLLSPRLCVLGLSCAILCLSACSAQGGSVQNQPVAKYPPAKIRVGTDTTLAPFETLDPDKNEFSGFDIELMRALGSTVNLSVEFVNMSLGQMLPAVARCSLDAGISSIAITEQLGQLIDFSDSYYTARHVVVVKKGNIVITGRDKLTDMVVGTQEGTPGEAEIDNVTDQVPVIYPTFSMAFLGLASGSIDAVIADKPHALVHVNIKPNNLKIVGDGFGSSSYGIAVCKTKQNLTKRINAGLAVIKADGTLDRLMQKYSLARE
jgi:ABC-type amino acid transport substrate-binding protein